MLQMRVKVSTNLPPSPLLPEGSEVILRPGVEQAEQSVLTEPDVGRGHMEGVVQVIVSVAA